MSKPHIFYHEGHWHRFHGGDEIYFIGCPYAPGMKADAIYRGWVIYGARWEGKIRPRHFVPTEST